MAHTQLMAAVDFGVGPTVEVVIVGDRGDAGTKAMFRALWGEFVPNKVVLFRPASEAMPAITRLAEFTREQRAREGKATVYVCQDYRCALPTTEAQKMLELLTGKTAEGR